MSIHLVFFVLCFCKGYCVHLYRHLRTPSFPTRRSSDLSHVGTIIRRFAGDRHVVDVALAQPGAGDPQEPGVGLQLRDRGARSEEHTSELQSLMRISYAVFCLKKKKDKKKKQNAVESHEDN